jgi:hypothetical protein
VIRNRDIARVAKQQSLPLWLAQAIAAEVVLKEQLRRRSPQRERRANQLQLLGYLLEREERT